MGNIDDYNDRMRQRTLGIPVGPATNAAQMAADMAAEAQNRTPMPARSGARASYGGSDYSVPELLVILVISVLVFAAGVAAASLLSGDIAFLGFLGIAAGGIFGVLCIAALLKRAAKAAFEMIVIAVAWTLHKVWRLVSAPFRRRR